MPDAVVALDFDPYLRLGGLSLRLETLGVAAAILVALTLAAVLAGRTAVGRQPEAGRALEGWSEPWHLRRDDLLFIVLGAVPGAVVVGRLGYALIHLDYYAANPAALADPSQGSLSLSGALVGGTLTGAYVARLLDAPVGRWLGLAAGPVLLGIALGKLAMALGGTGQGAFSDASWATAYARDAAWGSGLADQPAIPSQVLEAGMTLLVLLALLMIGRARPFRRRPARRYLAAVALWCLGRAVVATTWRDATVLGPLRAEQLLDVGLAAGCLVVLAVLARDAAARQARATAPAWPDPATRPRF